MDNPGLVPGDLLVVVKIAAHDGAFPSVRRLGEDLGMSKSAVAYSLQRLLALDLVKDDEKGGRRVNKLALRDCIEHGVRWIAPAKVGDFELGLPTAHAGPLGAKLVGDPDPLVMPLPHGPMRGRAVPPIHGRAPEAAAKDPRLYELLSLVDVFRIGRARDRQVAAAELRAWL